MGPIYYFLPMWSHCLILQRFTHLKTLTGASTIEFHQNLNRWPFWNVTNVQGTAYLKSKIILTDFIKMSWASGASWRSGLTRNSFAVCIKNTAPRDRRTNRRGGNHFLFLHYMLCFNCDCNARMENPGMEEVVSWTLIGLSCQLYLLCVDSN